MKPKQKIKFKNKSNIFYVYYHIDNQGNIFYIGKGKYNRAYITKNRSPEWKKKVKSCENGYGVCFFGIGFTDKQARDLEKKLIKEGFKQGLPLVNKTFGGQGVSKPYSKEQLKKFRLKRGKKVYCYQNGKTYLSASEAAEDLSLHQNHVNYCCNNKSLQAKGYEFDYVENLTKEELKMIRPKAKNIKKGIKIICEQTGEVFKSYYELTKKMNLEQSHVSKNIRGILRHVKGYTFKKYEEGDIISIKPKVDRKVKKVRCLTNSRVYKSINSACEDLKIDRRSIKKVCEGHIESIKGLKFEYLTD